MSTVRLRGSEERPGITLVVVVLVSALVITPASEADLWRGWRWRSRKRVNEMVEPTAWLFQGAIALPEYPAWPTAMFRDTAITLTRSMNVGPTASTSTSTSTSTMAFAIGAITKTARVDWSHSPRRIRRIRSTPHS